VAGSKKQVEAAQLILLAGGEDAVVGDCRPLLLKMGKHVAHAGGVGAGTALKLCMNLIVAQMSTALAESVTLAEAAGVDPAKIFEVIKQSPALDCGYFRIKETALLKKDFAPAFSLANMLKDVRFMNEEAASRGARLPVNQAVQALMETALAEGYGEKDLMSIYWSLRSGVKTSADA
jgi:3-hydroxyisobutyrate dehydrogenase-like beta-hydroxyacid dehydrogenase